MCSIAVLHDICSVFLIGKYHFIAQEPVAHGTGISFCVTVNRYVGAARCANQLIWYENHWRNCEKKNRTEINLFYFILIIE